MSVLESLVSSYLSEKDAYKIIELRNSILISVTHERGEKFIQILENLYEKEDDPAQKQNISKLLFDVISRTENTLETSRVIEFLSKTAKLTINFQQSVSSFRSILERHFKENDLAYEKINRFYKELTEKNIPQYPQKCRLDFLYIANFLVDSHLKGKIDHLEVETMCEAVGGEKDPRNLLKMFDLLAKLAERVAKQEKEFETIAKTYSVYYPIQFVPPKRDKIHITPLQLKKQLLKCFVANERLAPYSMEILIDSLYSEYSISERQTAVIEDTLYFLKTCKEKYKEKFSEYAKGYLEVLKVELFEHIEERVKGLEEWESDKEKEGDEEGSANVNLMEVRRVGETYFKEWKYIDERTKLFGEILKLFLKNLDQIEEEELRAFLVNLKKNIYTNYALGYIVGVLCENENLHRLVVNHIVMELLKDMFNFEESENSNHRDNIINILGIYIVPKMLIRFQEKTVNGNIIGLLKKLMKKEVERKEESREFRFKCLKLLLLLSCVVNTSEVQKVAKMSIKSLKQNNNRRNIDSSNNNNINNDTTNDDYNTEDTTTRTVLDVEQREQNEFGSDIENDSTQDEDSDDKTNEEDVEKIKKEVRLNMNILITIYKCHNDKNELVRGYLESLLEDDFEEEKRDITTEVKRISYLCKRGTKVRVSNPVSELLRIALKRYQKEDDLEKLVKKVIILSFNSLKIILNKCFNTSTNTNKNDNKTEQVESECKQECKEGDPTTCKLMVDDKLDSSDKQDCGGKDGEEEDDLEDYVEYANLVTEVFASTGSDMAVEILGRTKMIEYFGVLMIWYRRCLENGEHSELKLRFLTEKVPRMLAHIGEKVDGSLTRFLDPTLIFMKLYFKESVIEDCKGVNFGKYMKNIRREDVMPLNLLNLEALFMIKGHMSEIRELLKMGDMNGSILIKYLENHYKFNFKKVVDQVKVLSNYEMESLDYEDLFFFMTPISVKKVNPIIRHQLMDIRRSFREKIIDKTRLSLERMTLEGKTSQEGRSLVETTNLFEERRVGENLKFKEEREEMLKMVIRMYKGETKIGVTKRELRGMEGEELQRMELLISLLLILLNKGGEVVEEEHLEMVLESMSETLKSIGKFMEEQEKLGLIGLEREVDVNLQKLEMTEKSEQSSDKTEEEHGKEVDDSPTRQQSDNLENQETLETSETLKEQSFGEQQMVEGSEEQQEFEHILEEKKEEELKEYVEWCCDKYRLYVQGYLFEVMSNLNSSKYGEEKRERIKNIISNYKDSLLENVLSMYKSNQLPFSRILSILNLHSMVTSKFVKVEKGKKLNVIKKCSEFLGDPNKKVRNIAVLCRHQWINGLHD